MRGIGVWGYERLREFTRDWREKLRVVCLRVWGGWLEVVDADGWVMGVGKGGYRVCLRVYLG